MDALKFLQDLTVVLSTAAAVLLLFKRYKQPPVLGYITVGLLIGPHTPAMTLVADVGSLEALAQIGVVFLLFALGVEFNLKRLAEVGMRALICGGIEVILLLGVGYSAGVLLGMRPTGALLFGGVVALASTAIVARSLLEFSRKSQGWGELASGVLIAEDILAVAMIAFFSSAGKLTDLSLVPLIEELARFAVLVTVIVIPGLIVLPRILSLVEKSGMNEVRTLVIIGTCFGISFVTERLGFSAALGAFLAGAMMSETAAATKLRGTVEPFKDVFGAVFFVAVGMMIDPSWILVNWRLALGVLVAVVAGRLLANFIAFVVVGETTGSATQAAVARLPIGEFSFILAQIGDRKELTDWPLYPLAVLLSLGTTLISASLLPAALEAPGAVESILPRWAKSFLSEYHSGIKRLSVPKRAKIVYDLTRPSLIQIALNLLGISGLFIAAGAVEQYFNFNERLPGAVWIVAAFGSLPFLLALWRKTQAVTLILVEAITTRSADPRPPMETHPKVTRFLLGTSTVLVGWWYLSFSLTLLPPWPYTLVPLGVIFAAGTFLWQGMNRLYAKIQIALRDTLQRGHAAPEGGATVVTHLVEAHGHRIQIVPVRIGKTFGAVGSSIRQLGIRSKTGASILQINRDGETMASPGAGTHLHAGDEVLVVGDRTQVELARALLDKGVSDKEDSPEQ